MAFERTSTPLPNVEPLDGSCLTFFNCPAHDPIKTDTSTRSEAQTNEPNSRLLYCCTVRSDKTSGTAVQPVEFAGLPSRLTMPGKLTPLSGKRSSRPHGSRQGPVKRLHSYQNQTINKARQVAARTATLLLKSMDHASKRWRRGYM
jgi:hypothetical protein